MMSWFFGSKNKNNGNEIIKLRTQCLTQSNIFENRPSDSDNVYFFYENVPKQFTDNKQQNCPTQNPFRVNLEGTLSVHHFHKDQT